MAGAKHLRCLRNYSGKAKATPKYPKERTDTLPKLSDAEMVRAEIARHRAAKAAR